MPGIRNQESRLKKIEQKLSIDQEELTIFIWHFGSKGVTADITNFSFTKLVKALGEPTEEWLTVKDQVKEKPVNRIRNITVNPYLELQARREQNPDYLKDVDLVY